VNALFFLLVTMHWTVQSDDCSPTIATNTTRGDFRRAESANFVVVSGSPQHSAIQVAELCETSRAKSRKQWCEEKRETAWQPKCDVIIHASRRDYLAAVGRGGTQTFASTLIKFQKDKGVVHRRIDICGDGQLGLAALPHELTHMVLADLFNGRQPPRWADEGLAVLSDPGRKQLLHQRDLANCLSNRTEFRLLELMTLESYPDASRVPAFYGQSASLATFLIDRAEPSQFIEFLRLASQQGYDHALKEIYSIDDVNHLDRLWREQFAKFSQE
jgi:hypothetical protein